MPNPESTPGRGRKPNVERHTTARAARLELADVLARLKDECGIERQKVAELLGIKPPMLSRMAAENVSDRPTLMPPDGWRETLAAALVDLGDDVHRIARALRE